MSNARLLPILGLPLALALSLTAPQLAQASEAARGEPLYWVAPMDPNYRRPGPGKSPMGMDLVPVYEAPESSGVVTVSAERQQAFGVRLAAVSKGPLESTLRGSVVVSLPDQARWDLVLREDSWILDRWVASAGERVARGAPLFKVDVPAWAQDQDAWLAAKAAGDEPLQAATAKRLQRQGFPEDALEALKSDGKIQNPLVLRAPEAGLVTAISANAGAFLKAGTPLLSLTGAEGLWLEVFFAAGAPEKLSAGNVVNISLPGRDPFPVSLTWIDQTLTADARALRGRATITEADALALGLRSGETGTAELRWASAGATRRIPLGAILPGVNGEPDRVLKAMGNDSFKPTPVHLGMRGRRYAEVLHGLALGDQVVAQGTFLLEAEANRAAELARLTPEDDHSTMDHSTTDHSTMDHSTMDHSTMDHSTMDHSTMDHSTMDHSTMDHSTMDHSTMDHSTTDHSTMDHSTMDHSTMDHSTMDHSTMDHSTMDHSTMDHSTMDHSTMDHSTMDHSTMDHSTMDHSTMDHSTMDHSTMDHSTMDHSTMDHSTMDHSTMDHSTMDHSTMDHSTMDHSTMDHSTMDHSTMDHSTMDHSTMDHSTMDHSTMDHSTMDHSTMDHSTMDHSTMDHSTMDHSTMDHSTMDHSTMDHSTMDHSTMDHSTMDHSTMDHSTMDHSTMDHSTMDHSTMDHSTMDHSTMDHSTMDHSTMDHSTMDHSTMDHSTMDHSTMDHSTMDHSTMDHSTMDHSTMDHSTMDHSTMDHSTMDHGEASP